MVNDSNGQSSDFLHWSFWLYTDIKISSSFLCMSNEMLQIYSFWENIWKYLN